MSNSRRCSSSQSMPSSLGGPFTVKEAPGISGKVSESAAALSRCTLAPGSTSNQSAVTAAEPLAEAAEGGAVAALAAGGLDSLASATMKFSSGRHEVPWLGNSSTVEAISRLHMDATAMCQRGMRS